MDRFLRCHPKQGPTHSPTSLIRSVRSLALMLLFHLGRLRCDFFLYSHLRENLLLYKSDQYKQLVLDHYSFHRHINRHLHLHRNHSHHWSFVRCLQNLLGKDPSIRKNGASKAGKKASSKNSYNEKRALESPTLSNSEIVIIEFINRRCKNQVAPSDVK